MTPIRYLLPLTFLALLWQCSTPKRDVYKSSKAAFKPHTVLKTKALVIQQISPNAFIHTSYKQTDDFGNVPCNGLVVRNGNETVIFDTPTNDSSAEALIRWVEDALRCRINAVVPTHFHDDCLGGLDAFHRHEIPSYAYVKTIELARTHNEAVPQYAFSDPLILKAGNDSVIVTHFGEGHTADNVVGYFPSEHILFGGCLVKALDAGKGYLGDANLAEWSATVATIKQAYPHLQLVVPGHGNAGDTSLLGYTIRMFEND